MANPQALKEYEKEPLHMRILRGFCSDVRIYDAYSTRYQELFSLVWGAVEKGELTEQQGRQILEECRNVKW